MTSKYSNTILGTIVAVLGLGLLGLLFLPTSNPTTQVTFFGVIILVINTLLGTRQAENNGHRLTNAEDKINANSERLNGIENGQGN